MRWIWWWPGPLIYHLEITFTSRFYIYRCTIKRKNRPLGFPWVKIRLVTLIKDALIPNYDHWRTINVSNLYKSCVKEGAYNCDFRVDSSYNFTGKYWLSNGERLDDVIWKSFAYPNLNDIITVCGFMFDPVRISGERSFTYHIDSIHWKWDFIDIYFCQVLQIEKT